MSRAPQASSRSKPSATDVSFQRPTLRVRDELRGVARGLVGLPRLVPRWSDLPRGAGEPVLVLPGFMTSDTSTLVLRRFLSRLGYAAYGWGLGRNHGRVEELVPQTLEHIDAIAQRHGAPLRLVGWSLGGVIARESARESPERVERIVTMGTPVVGGPKHTAAAERYLQRGADLDRIAARVAERNAVSIDAPITCIYSKLDAVVAWRACLDPNPDNQVEYVEVALAHSELGVSAQVLEIVARRLAAT